MSEPWHDLITYADRWRVEMRHADDAEAARFSVWTHDAEHGWSRLTGELHPARVREDVIELLGELLELDRARLAGTDLASRRYAMALVDHGVTA